jgi:hypothetical protein
MGVEIAAGDWRGIHFFGPAPAGNTIRHARIEYAGGDCSCSGYGCAAPSHGAIIFFVHRPETAFIQDTVIAHSAGHGVTSGWRSAESGPDFRPTNTFEDVAGCQQSGWSSPTNACAAWTASSGCLP